MSISGSSDSYSRPRQDCEQLLMENYEPSESDDEDSQVVIQEENKQGSNSSSGKPVLEVKIPNDEELEEILNKEYIQPMHFQVCLPKKRDINECETSYGQLAECLDGRKVIPNYIQLHTSEIRPKKGINNDPIAAFQRDFSENKKLQIKLFDIKHDSNCPTGPNAKSVFLKMPNNKVSIFHYSNTDPLKAGHCKKFCRICKRTGMRKTNRF